MPFFKPNIEKLKSKGDINGLIEALHYPDQEIIKAASAALCQIGAPAVEKLIPALRTENQTVPYFAAWVLGEIRDSRAVEPLIYALQNKNKELRKQAAQALGKIGAAQAVEPLLLALKDRDGEVVVQVASALDKLGWKPDNNLNGAYYWCAKREWKKCVEIGTPAVESLIDALKRTEREVRLEAADALAKIGVPVVKPLINALKGAERDVRLEAANVLVEIGAPAVNPLIYALEN
jgi:HEAT repeat protein